MHVLTVLDTNIKNKINNIKAINPIESDAYIN